MKNIVKGIAIAIVSVIILYSICFLILGLSYKYFGPDYKQGEYTMIYKVYYPNNPKTYTIKNDWPISMTSNRGTNRIKKTIHNSIYRKCYGSETIIETSAPIEVVSYTFKEK